MNNIVKCDKCNIIINEVLAFVQNKIEVMDDESLMRVCTTGFSCEALKEAKILLFSSVPSSKKRMITRKGDGKMFRDIEDIIGFFKETDPEIIPIFVARDLNKLPPISFDHIDVTRLLKDLLILKSEVVYIKENYATLQHVANEVNEIQKSTPLDIHVNMKRGGYMDMMDSGPFAMTMTHEHETAGGGERITTDTRKACCESPTIQLTTPPRAPVMLPLEPVCRASQCRPRHQSVGENSVRSLNATSNETLVRARGVQNKIDSSEMITTEINRPSMADIVRREGDWKVEKPTEEWVLVQRRRLRNRFVGQKGRASTQPDEKFKAADIRVPLFISNVHKDTLESDIVDYVKEKTNESVTMEKIKMKQDRGYNSYKVLVPSHKVDVFLDDKLWPSGISFRRFVRLFPKNKEGEDAVIDNTNK